MALNDLLERSEVAQRYKKSEGTINNWVSKKFIPCTKIGRTVLFDVKDLEIWEKRNKIKPVSVNKSEHKLTPDTL